MRCMCLLERRAAHTLMRRGWLAGMLCQVAGQIGSWKEDLLQCNAMLEPLHISQGHEPNLSPGIRAWPLLATPLSVLGCSRSLHFLCTVQRLEPEKTTRTRITKTKGAMATQRTHLKPKSCDGTWGNSVGKSDGPATNVTRLSRSLRRITSDGTHQIIYYHPPLGTGGLLETPLREGPLGRVLGAVRPKALSVLR